MGEFRIDPSDALKRLVLREAGWRCELAWVCCTFVATEVDHVVSRVNDNRRANLQAVCVPCHREKTNAENRVANAVLLGRGKRPVDAHPGRVV